MEPCIIETTWKTNVVYHEFKCCECGKIDRNTYSEPYRTNMLDRRLCWECNYSHDLEIRMTKNHTEMTIIEGHVYTPGNATTGPMRGMSGRRFDIEYIEPSKFSGKRITTFDLWSGSTMSDKLRAKFPDTAIFLNGAERQNAGGTMCWDSSRNQNEPYPLPRTIGLKP